ncbi:hypothetical protein Ate02nite_47490 [Paractinoplanes tereljensis]|uniref:Polyketide cyclase/dehydrase/lipid transport protein n=1 Tax=Paractinoplanes tereljensis TaxID=571912 RepID=A0A919NQ66_9ACTN|nr:hypothetical protein Ate02nite_47490 [Actinoplanes tereljensis]
MTTDIDAPVDLLWRLTTEIDKWPAFLPTVQRVDRLDPGELRVGSTARLKQPAQASAIWTVTHLDPMREFTWETSRPGLRLTGRHLLETTGTGTRMTLALDVTGRLAGVLSALLGGPMQSSLRRESEGFAAAIR